MIRNLLATTFLLTSGTAYAQDGTNTITAPQGTPPAADAASQTTTPAPSAPPQSDGGIADIIVTASRRSENVQRSALSIQAISSEDIARRGVTRPEDLSAIAPGVSVATGGNYPQTYIRGVGNYAVSAYAEGAVAYNLDGVYISRAWATRGIFFDLDRVEVLKGPQGTLYGRNASGGAVNVITARPRLGRTDGFVEMEAGNYDLMRGTAAVNLPIGSTTALRLAAQVTHRNGYLSTGYDDDKSQSLRAHFLWEPSSDVSLLLTGGYQHIGGQGAGSVINPPLKGSRWRASSDPAVRAIVAAQPGIGGLLAASSFGTDGRLNIEVKSVSGELNWKLGGATLTILPAYREADLIDKGYVPGFRVDNNEHNEQSSAEVRLGGDTDSLKWVIGGYFFNEAQSNIDGRDLQIVRQGVNAQRTGAFDAQTRSYAGFGQATYSLTDAFRITGGLRYTYERKRQGGLTSTFTFPNAAPPPACAGAGYVFDPTPPAQPLFCRLDIPLAGRLTFKNWTWKAGLEADVGPASMLYANVSTGFKSGGFFSAPQPNTFRPEKLLAFDAGIKNRFFNNRLQLNVEAFYWRYTDHQEGHLGPTSIPGFFTFITENAGKAKSYGADLDLLYQPSDTDQFNVKVQYNKSNYDTFIYSNPTAAFGPPTTGCSVGPLVNGSQTVNCSGYPLVRSPTWTGTAGYNHTFELSSGDKITAGISGQFASKSYLSIDFLPTGTQNTYATADADLSFTTAGGKLTVTGYVRNITNEAVLTQVARYPFLAAAANPAVDRNGLITGSIRPPRTYGMRLRYNF